MEITKEYFDGEFTDKLSKKLTDSMSKNFVTKEHFDETLAKMATKEGLEKLESRVIGIEGTVTVIESRVTGIEGKVTGIETNIVGIKAAVNLMATQESVDDIRNRIIPMEQTLSRHTTLLDKIVYGEKKADDEEIIKTYRLGRAEKHIEQLAKNANLKLEY